jgi:hypothetical protein
MGNTLKLFCDQIEVVKPNNAAFLRARLQGCTLEASPRPPTLPASVFGIISKTVPKFVNRFDDVSHNADAIKSFIRLLYEENEATPVLLQRLLECVGFDGGFTITANYAHRVPQIS